MEGFKATINFSLYFKMLFCFLLVYSYITTRAQQCKVLCNPDFEDIKFTPPGSLAFVENGEMPCWRTTASDSTIEVWGDGFFGVRSYSGDQFIELNAYMVATLYQNFTVIPGTNITIGFAHRGRAGIDTISVSIGPNGGPYITLGYFGDDRTDWNYYTLNYIVPSNLGNYYSLRFNSIYAAGGNQTIGNFLDAISVYIPGPEIIITSNGVLCFNSADGSASAQIVGGTPPYSYVWSPSGGNAASATGLTAGTYSVTVTDSNSSCEVVDSVTITQPPANIKAIASENVSCFNGTNGYASVFTTGAKTSYSFVWSPSGGANDTANNLSAGTYTVVVTDSNNCSQDTALIIAQPDSLILNIFQGDTICQGQSTVLNAAAAGGTAPYTYHWTPGAMTGSPNISPSVTTIYIVTVNDLNNCPASPDSVTIYVNPSPSVSIVNINNVSCFNGADGNASILVEGGTSPYSYIWAPYGGNTSSARELAAGIYSIVVIDSNNCATDTFVIITQPEPLAINTELFSICGPQKAQIAVTGGNIFNWYNISGSPIVVGPEFSCNPCSNPVAQPYVTTSYIVISDSGSNCVKRDTLVVEVKNIKADFRYEKAECSNKVQFENLSSDSALYYWKFGDGIENSKKNPSHTYLSDGEYSVVMIINYDSVCIDTAVAVIVIENIFESITFSIPNVFTPNNDGKNDFLEIMNNNPCIDIKRLTIFNRWGVKIYEKEDDGVSQLKWDGTEDGRVVTDGIYFYLFQGNGFKESGSITLLR